jgi:hypothetical protein
MKEFGIPAAWCSIELGKINTTLKAVQDKNSSA